MSDGPTTADPDVAQGRVSARWRPAAAPLAVWALLLGTLAGVQAGFGGDLLPVLVQGGAAAATGLIALAVLLGSRIERRRATGVRSVPDLSIASALAAVSLAAMLSGAAVGSWLIIGGGLGLAAAMGGLIREWRAERRAREAAVAGRPRDMGGGLV
ncbi:MAG: hypothetical protein ACR2ND_05570 [Solirubrobacteraceae bacterium]